MSFGLSMYECCMTVIDVDEGMCVLVADLGTNMVTYPLFLNSLLTCLGVDLD